MNITYKSRKLEKSLTIDKELIKAYNKQAKKIKQRKTQLESAATLLDIDKLPQLRLHQYKGDRRGEWSIDIHKNWRLIFEIVNDPIPMIDNNNEINLNQVTDIRILSIEDPH